MVVASYSKRYNPAPAGKISIIFTDSSFQQTESYGSNDDNINILELVRFSVYIAVEAHEKTKIKIWTTTLQVTER